MSVDKVQIYYATALSIGLFVKCFRAYYSPDELVDGETTNTQSLVYFILGLGLGLPIIGRIFLWW